MIRQKTFGPWYFCAITVIVQEDR